MISDDNTLNIALNDDNWLKAFLRKGNYDPKSALQLMKNFYKFKSEHPEITKASLAEVRDVLENEIIQLLPVRNKFGGRVLLINVRNWNPSQFSLGQLFRTAYVISIITAHEPIDRLVERTYIYDVYNLGFQHIFAYSMSLTSSFQSVLHLTPYPKAKPFIVNNSGFFSVLWNLISMLFSKQEISDMEVIGSDYGKIVDLIGGDNLEKRLGGTFDNGMPFGKALYHEIVDKLNYILNFENL